jgi:DNA-directed RNA polymerase II subunit RPB2
MRSALNVANAKSKPRQLSGNMWGKTCPAETPEGLHIGIDKNAAIATHFSLQGDKQTLIECLQQISRSYALYFALSSSLSSLSRTMFLCKIMVNGDWIGGTAVPQRLIRDFKTARRTPLRWNGAIPLDASITFDPISNTIEIFCDAGRPCRPLLIVDSENSRSLASSTSAHHHHHQKPCRLILQYEHISSLLAEHLKRKSTHHQTGEEEQKKKKKEQEENVSVVDGSEKNKLQKLSRHQKASSSSSSSLMKKIRNWTDLFRYGILEFVDACEEEISLIATFPEDLVSNEQQTRPLYYTHCEIHPSTILGIAASTIPFSNHNQSPRNTYQSAMIKQAQGVLSTRESARCTTESFELWYGQRPIVLTQAGRALNMVNMPCTVNAIIAIACFGGYNQEDAILMNQSSVDRGFARSYYRRTYSDQCHEIRNKSGQNMVYMFANASVISKIGMTMPNGVFVRETVQGMRGNYDKLDIDGTPMQGMRFKKGDVIIGKVYEICIASSSSGGETHNYGSQQQLKPMNSVITLDSSKSVPMGGTTVYAKRTIHDCSTVWPLEMDGVCETVIRTVNAQGTPIIKATFRCMCIPQIGDKFAAMPGQKGVIGMMYRQEDMLYSAKDGTPVDIILNPHAIPSRMTIGTLIEGLGCKVAFLKGMELDATPFANTTSSEGMVAQLSAILHELGYESRGTEKLIHPHTGIPMEAAIFFGAMQYQRLRHMVDFKIQSRQRGPVDPLTRQPMQGKKRDGGGRFGEMERDATLAHGAMAMVRDRLLLNSDHYRVPVCENCGSIVSVVASRKSPSQQRQHTNLGAFNENIKNVKCNSAKCSKTIGVIEWSWIVLPYAMYLLHMELLAMGLRMKFGTRPTTV